MTNPIEMARLLEGDYSQLEGMDEAAKQRLIAFAKASGNTGLAKEVNGK